MRVKSRPIIEHCERLKVAPYCLAYPALPAQLARCQLPSETGMWREVDDFGWIKAIQSPNWCVLPWSLRGTARSINVLCCFALLTNLVQFAL